MKLKITLAIILTLILSISVKAQESYLLAEINLGYGMLDLTAGGGSLNIAVDRRHRIIGIGIDVIGGVFGFDEHVLAAQTLDEMMAGKSLNYEMKEAKQPLFKVTALENFGAYGGEVRISMRNSNGFQTMFVNIARDSESGRYHLYENKNKVKELAINLRGYGIPELYIGWYELNLF